MCMNAERAYVYLHLFASLFVDWLNLFLISSHSRYSRLNSLLHFFNDVSVDGFAQFLHFKLILVCYFF